ncbi:MAG: STAS domain-containing protein [Gammaproteobacteria bacterium]|nr:STAS domain-containing protein [Gammaproteobacteria bacterium]
MTLSQRGAGVWHLAGVLDMTSVPTLRDAADTLVDAPEVLVDLCEVTRMDSAGLALLVDWQGQARGRRTKLRFRNLPADIAGIAEVYGLGAVLLAEDFRDPGASAGIRWTGPARPVSVSSPKP